MSDGRCPRCGGARSGGVCPRCVLAAALDPATDTDLTPRQIGSYRVFDEIARGGNGVVYRAWQTDLKREVALKMLLSARLENPDALQRFRREAELMAQLDVPGILPIYEVGEHDGAPYFSMKLAEGGSLAERIAALRGKFDTIARLLANVAHAVDRAHRGGVLHRDLKPSNIVFDTDDQALVTDFGLARHLGADSSLTGAEALIGTPRYVAPEVITDPGAELTPAVDVYGLGAILYELLTGQPPFAELTPLQVLHEVASRAPVSPRALNPAVPPDLETICLRCLEKRPRDRYTSAQEFARALEDWLDGQTQPMHWWRKSPRYGLPSRRRRLAWLLAGCAVLGSGAVAGLLVWLDRPVLPDPAVTTRTLAVIPTDLPNPAAAELAAIHTLAARLSGAQPLQVLPADTVLKSAKQVDFPKDEIDRGTWLGAYMQVRVELSRGAGGERFVLHLIDSLRGDVLWAKSFDAQSIESAVDEIIAVLKQRRSVPTPETHVPATALAEFVRGTDLFMEYAAGANDKAIETFRHAISLAPDWALAHAMLAECYSERSNRFADSAFWSDAAIEEAEHAIRLDPTLGGAQAVLGQAYYNKGWLTRSAEAFERARSLDGRRAGMALALIHYVRGEFDQGYELIRAQPLFEAGDVISTYMGALSLFALGATDQGEVLMHNMIAVLRRPEKRSAAEAEIALYRGDYARCRELAAKLDPFQSSGGTITAGSLGRACAMHQGDYVGTLALLEPELGRKKAGKGDLVNMPELEQAILLSQLNRRDQAKPLLVDARRQIQAMIDSGSENWKNWQRLAAVQRLSGNVDEAYHTLDAAFAHGMTINARTTADIEFLPFKDDARFAELRQEQAAKLAAMRKHVLALVSSPDPTTAMPDDGKR